MNKLQRILSLHLKKTATSMRLFLRQPVAIAASLLTLSTLLTAIQRANPPASIHWKIDNTTFIGNYNPIVLGNPMVVNDKGEPCVSFNGLNDGLILPKIPVEGWKQFTIEVLFKPAGDGPREPRFLHFQDSALNRCTFEIRLTPDSKWYMDTFLKNGNTNKGLTLIDSTILHPADQWFWVALVYDGKKMTSFVNRQKELEGEIDFPPITKGDLALGVRLNKVSWFKGLIKEVRFHPVCGGCKSIAAYRLNYL